MDVQDVSDSQQYVALLQRQSKSLKQAFKRRGETPGGKPTREALLMSFNTQIFQHRFQQSYSERNFVRSSFIPPPYLPSIASLEELRKIQFRELKLETHHRGTFLLVRTITLPLDLSGLSIAVEDEEGDVETLYVYQQDTQLSPDESLPQGCAWMIKEPYYKILGDGTYGIRVDHVSDLIKLNMEGNQVPTSWRKDAVTKTANQWKEDGNAQLSTKNYCDAIEW